VATTDEKTTEERMREYLRGPYPRLVTGLTLISGSRALAEEAVQEALARAWEQELHGHLIQSLGAWVGAVATNLARSHVRRLAVELRGRQRLRQGAIDESVASQADQAVEMLDLRRAIARLPRRQQEVLVLVHFADLDIHEVAVALRKNDGAVRALLFRARRSLAERLGETE